jgi:hypothetical protein
MQVVQKNDHYHCKYSFLPGHRLFPTERQLVDSDVTRLAPCSNPVQLLLSKLKLGTATFETKPVTFLSRFWNRSRQGKQAASYH